MRIITVLMALALVGAWSVAGSRLSEYDSYLAAAARV